MPVLRENGEVREMTLQEQNEALAQWAGIECRCENGRFGWSHCPRHSNGGKPPDYDRDEVAVGLLDVLVDKGYMPTLDWTGKVCGWRCDFWLKLGVRVTMTAPTIAAAIKVAVLQLIEKE
jgi:hypothetical protein